MNTEQPQNDHTPDEDAESRPLGFWLRTVDVYLARELAQSFEREGVSPRDWMLLNAVAGDSQVPGFADRLARTGKRLRGLEHRGWAEESGDGTWTLTDVGRAAKERLGALVDGIRSRVAGAVAPEDFATTLTSLEAIARELGWNEDDRMPWMGFGRGFGRGFGPGLHRGFRPGFGPGGATGMPGHQEDAAHGHQAHHDHGEWRGRGEWPWHGRPDHHHGHGHHPHHDHGRPADDAQSAYERGFDAGFTRGRAAS
jgi:hypothetical protein